MSTPDEVLDATCGTPEPTMYWAVAGPEGTDPVWRPLNGWTVTEDGLVYDGAVEFETHGVRGLMSMTRLDVQPVVEAFDRFGRQLVDGVGRAALAVGKALLQPTIDAMHRAGWVKRDPAQRRRHRRRCPTCNPGGNPRPLAIDGHEYRRRRTARARRRR